MTNFEFEIREALMQEEHTAVSENFIKDHIEELLTLPEEWFGATICMLLEEYCKAKGINMPEYSKKMLETIIQVNKTFGRY